MQSIKVVFACVHNAGRSQMAATILNRLADQSKATAISAGTNPAEAVHPEVVAVMRAFGVDLSSVVPTFLAEELLQGANLLITMGCGENCPYVPGLEREDWPLEDPKGQSTEKVLQIRAEIERRVRALLTRLGALNSAASVTACRS